MTLRFVSYKLHYKVWWLWLPLKCEQCAPQILLRLGFLIQVRDLQPLQQDWVGKEVVLFPSLRCEMQLELMRWQQL